MSKRTMVLAGSMWVALLGGCVTETETTSRVDSAAPLAANSTSSHTMTPRLGAGDSLGRQMFAQDRTAGGPVFTSTASVEDAD